MIFSYFSFLLFQINHVCHCRNLQQKNQRHSIAEERFHCLVVETFHSNPSPYASANSSRCHQHPFRNAPPMAAGFPFVQTVHGESQHVNCNQVIKYDIHEWCMFSCCKGTTIFLIDNGFLRKNVISPKFKTRFYVISPKFGEINR